MGLKQGESPMKYYKGKAEKSGPLKIAPALIAKLAPTVISAMSDKGGGSGGGGSNEPQKTEVRKKGLDNWLEK